MKMSPGRRPSPSRESHGHNTPTTAMARPRMIKARDMTERQPESGNLSEFRRGGADAARNHEKSGRDARARQTPENKGLGETTYSSAAPLNLRGMSAHSMARGSQRRPIGTEGG